MLFLLDVAAGICLKLHDTASLNRSHPAFSQSVSLEMMWCNHIIILSRLPMRILTSFSVDEIYLLMFVN